jgi:hypothetical protein
MPSLCRLGIGVRRRVAAVATASGFGKWMLRNKSVSGRERQPYRSSSILAAKNSRLLERHHMREE